MECGRGTSAQCHTYLYPTLFNCSFSTIPMCPLPIKRIFHLLVNITVSQHQLFMTKALHTQGVCSTTPTDHRWKAEPYRAQVYAHTVCVVIVYSSPQDAGGLVKQYAVTCDASVNQTLNLPSWILPWLKESTCSAFHWGHCASSTLQPAAVVPQSLMPGVINNNTARGAHGIYMVRGV